VDHAVIAGLGAFLAGYVVGALPVAWLLVRRRHGVDMRRRGTGGTGSLDAVAVGGIKTALMAAALEVLKGAAIGVAARLYTDTGWFIAAAVAGCVAGDAFPIGFRRGGRGLVPLVAGLVVALPAAGLITAITAVPAALFTSMRGSVYDAVVLVAVPVGLLVGTREWQSLGPAAAIVVVLLARSTMRRRRQAALSRRPDWHTIVDVEPSAGATPPAGRPSRQNAAPWDS
jgi:acyl phosphate:glycerol-3-phosphate acyltransferase